MLLSIPYVSPLSSAAAPEGVDLSLVVRGIDFEMGRFRKALTVLRDAIRTLSASRRADATVVCTTMADVVVLALLYRLRPNHRLAAWDFLLPTSVHVRRAIRWPLKRVDDWFVIRSGDADILRRHVGADNARFIPFPVQPWDVEQDAGTTDSGAVYAAGSAHRDWTTLVEASRRSGVPVLISTNNDLPPYGDVPTVTIIPLGSPAEGRRRLIRARAVCVPLEDTELPCGPLVILDAMAAGKAIVTTEVNGAKDYVVSGVTALVVPPRDPAAMAAALEVVETDEALRSRLGEEARAAAAEFTPDRVIKSLAEALRATQADD